MKRSRTAEVEVPITPMLDMAFQLLTFFILTYHPAPSEGSFSMNLLPAQPVTKIDAPANDADAASGDLPASLRTLETGLYAGSDGQLGRVSLGDNTLQGMPALETELAAILGDKNLPFDQALIRVDPRLHYDQLIRVIDIFSRLKVTKISFAELVDDGTGM